MQFQKISIIGVGLLGGSIGLAVKRRKLACEVAGYVRRAASLKDCEQAGAVDYATTDLLAAVSNSDLIILCTPLAQMRSLVEQFLPAIVMAVKKSGHPVVWACDPMHGNTYQHESGYNTRHFDTVMDEIAKFFGVCHAEGVWPGGVHVELTGDNVTECLGGGDAVTGSDLDSRYETLCDPRLNARQGLDLAFRLAELMRG